MPKSYGLVQRLLEVPGIPTVVPRLGPEVLHRVIQACGLEDCGELLAHATPAQLARVLDADVWRAARPGIDETFDPDRFGLWLVVLLEAGADVAAEKLAGLDIDLVTTGLAQHLIVFDQAAVASYVTLDGEHVAPRTANDRLGCDVGGYLIEARRTSAWDAIVELLTFLEGERPEFFGRLMRGCVRLSSGAREKDGFHTLLDDRAQDMFDLAVGREARREARGYVAPAQARAFLLEARDLQLDAHDPKQSAAARAYFRDLASMFPATPDASTADEQVDVKSPAEGGGQPDGDSIADFVEILEEAGVVNTRPRALLGAGDGEEPVPAFVRAYAEVHPSAEEELGYLANVVVAGCSMQGRAFTIREASECAAAVCNLGLENWPSGWADRSLIAAFQVGWAVLHRNVCMYSAERLIEVLRTIRCRDLDIQQRLDALRRRLIGHAGRGEPWHVLKDLDVILMLDAPCWAALRGLLDECPVLHVALRPSGQAGRTIDPANVDFISRNSQVALVRAFLAGLPAVLSA